MDFIYKFIENPSNLPSFFHTIGIALLTILIPISIAMFSREREYVELDKNVILDGIFRPILFLIILGLIFLPALFWHISTFEFKIIELILWISGIFLMITILKKSYSWIKGNKYKYRINYLSNLKNEIDLIESMRSVWQKDDMDVKSEIDFLKIFSMKIEQYIKINYKLTSELLRDFRIFLNNPKIFFPILNEIALPKILEWDYLIWKLKKNNKDNMTRGGSKSKNSLTNYFKTKNFLYFIFVEYEKRALQEWLDIDSYFLGLELHIEGILEKSNNAQKSYLKYFFNNFYSVFFTEISNIPKINDMWSCYPERWKVIYENYNKSILPGYSLVNFCNWAKERIRQPKEDIDTNLDEVANGLFPKVDHQIWAIILIFVLLPFFEEKDRIDNVIRHPWNFGQNGVYVYKSTEEREERFDNTYKLAKLLFKEQFSEKNLENYTNILSRSNVKYEKDPNYKDKSQELLAIFKEMLKNR